ncbi:hypothetical protein [Arthrobacter livingstonensis]|uniref:hypothetical protein n=1 Tax=Arthrobacter livingstonensis TaxID=670078 RepID=UPI0011B802F1|nr:hypothetical protein [Arthrobacter livingstonensis]
MSINFDIKAPVVVLGIAPAGDLAESIRISESFNVFMPKSAAVAVGHEQKWECWLDGCVILDDRALLNSLDLANAVESQRSDIDFVEYWGHSARCSGAAYILNLASGTVKILPDPLGGCSLFRFESQGVSLLSTDLKSLVDVALLLSINLEKNMLFQLERISLGVGNLSGSPYEDVRIVDQFKYVVISGTGVSEEYYDAYESFMDDGDGHADLLLRARAEILSNLKALSNITDVRKVCHITGGFDSRLVTAGLIELGQDNNFDFFCSGPDGTADRVVADGISVTFGLNRYSDSGLHAESVDSLEERFLLPMVESAGVSMTGPTGREVVADVAILGGGFGELLRSFYSKLAPEYSLGWEPMKLAKTLFGDNVFAPNRLFGSVVAQELTGKLQERFKSLYDEGLPEDFLGDSFYSRSRNRLHIGQNAMLWSRYGHRFDPLYSVAGFTLARRLPVSARGSNVIGFDIMDSFRGGLSGYPFDRERKNAAYLNLRRPMAPKSFTSGVPNIVKLPRNPVVRNGTRHVRSAADMAVRSHNIKKANSIGVNFWQINDLSVTQGSVRGILEDLDWHNLSPYLNREYIARIAREDLSSRQEIRDIYSVYSTLLWYVR